MALRTSDFGVSLGCLALLGYFAWHSNEGPRGYPYRDRLVATAAKLEADLAEQQKARAKFEHKVGLLRPESIDPDLLDEMARRTLEVAKPSELIVMENPH
jgi:cell division protein FtsB